MGWGRGKEGSVASPSRWLQGHPIIQWLSLTCSFRHWASFLSEASLCGFSSDWRTSVSKCDAHSVAFSCCPRPWALIPPYPQGEFAHLLHLQLCWFLSVFLLLMRLAMTTLGKVLQRPSITVKIGGQGPARVESPLEAVDGGWWCQIQWQRADDSHLMKQETRAAAYREHLAFLIIFVPQFGILEILATSDWHLSKTRSVETSTSLWDGLFNTNCWLLGTCLCWVWLLSSLWDCGG